MTFTFLTYLTLCLGATVALAVSAACDRKRTQAVVFAVASVVILLAIRVQS